MQTLASIKAIFDQLTYSREERFAGVVESGYSLVFGKKPGGICFHVGGGRGTGAHLQTRQSDPSTNFGRDEETTYSAGDCRAGGRRRPSCQFVSRLAFFALFFFTGRFLADVTAFFADIGDAALFLTGGFFA